MDNFAFTRRSRKPFLKKLNPFWWVQNDDQQTVEQAPWYQPTWPQWLRWLVWNGFRNPLQNFRAYVIGVQDRNYIATGRPPVTVIQRDDMPDEWGFQWCVLHGGDLWLPRPFISFSSSWMVVQFGWQFNGFATVKFNKFGGYLSLAAIAVGVWYAI